MVHIFVECILNPFKGADLYFDKNGNLAGRSEHENKVGMSK